MNIFNLISRLFSPSPNSPTDQEQQINRFNQKAADVKQIFEAALEMYHEQHCQCAYPRFIQLVQIDCTHYGQSFKCWDTEILMGTAKKYFDETESSRTDEASNKTWTCKTCGSIYEWGWSDFSIGMERQKLKLTELKTPVVGKSTSTPIGIYFGLSGHTLPAKDVIQSISLEAFRDYLMEK